MIEIIKKGDRHLIAIDGKEYAAGDFQDSFTMQSVVKPLILLQALMDSARMEARYRRSHSSSTSFSAMIRL